ncbi:MAG: hypothetical protein AB2784_00200, partial [Candidatus Thiodiazotropha endolucinida]
MIASLMSLFSPHPALSQREREKSLSDCFLNSRTRLVENSKLKTQNSKLKTQNSKLKTQNSKL